MDFRREESGAGRGKETERVHGAVGLQVLLLSPGPQCEWEGEGEVNRAAKLKSWFTIVGTLGFA